jgi:hypothetical protein
MWTRILFDNYTLVNSYALDNPNNSKHDGGYQDVELPFENGKSITIPSPKFSAKVPF